ncbi:hypothetical protein ACFPH6_08045 [Streptomyces xiangluensis]|uniref:Uncharacterized protein n=1 Tax=Streptomyces xiangluensis TaxID=2665720 RepID=A0ABV8YJU1_9ACTN
MSYARRPVASKAEYHQLLIQVLARLDGPGANAVGVCAAVSSMATGTIFCAAHKWPAMLSRHGTPDSR